MGIIINILRKLKYTAEPQIKDYTPEAEERMVKVAADVNADEDIIDKYVTDPFGRWLDKQGLLDIITGVDRYQKSVIDCYNYSAENIHRICYLARSYDSSYGSAIASRVGQSENVVTLISNLAECIDPGSKYYDGEPLSERLLGFFSKEFDNERVQDIAGKADSRKNQFTITPTSDEDLEYFCRKEENRNIFKEYYKHVFDDELDWSTMDLVILSGGTVIYKGVEMTIDEALSLISKENYSSKMVRNQLNALISGVISADKDAQTFLKSHDEAKDAIEKLIKDYLEDEDKNSEFKDFVNKLGGITTLKALAEKSPELIDYLFNDYTRGLQIIRNIEKTVEQSGTAEMRSAVEILKQNYDSKWVGLLRHAYDFCETMEYKLSEKILKDWIKDEVGDTTVILTVLEIYDVESTVDAMHKLLALDKIASGLQKGYDEAFEKIQSGNYTEEDKQYLEDMFAMLKETTKEVYKTYRDMNVDDPAKQVWCNEQIEKLEKISIESFDRYTFSK